MRRVWDVGFIAGSYVAPFVQGVTAAHSWPGADRERTLCRRGVLLGTSVGADVRGRVVYRLCDDGIVLAGRENRRPGARVRLSVVAVSGIGFARFSRDVAGHLAYAASAGHGPLGAATYASPVPVSRPTRGRWPCLRVETPPGLLAVPLRRGDLRRRVRHVGRLVPALHDSVHRIDRAGGRAAVQSIVHVLGCRDHRPAAHPCLYRGRLLHRSRPGHGRRRLRQ